MSQEIIWIRKPGIGVFPAPICLLVAAVGGTLAIIEDDDFVNAENSEGAGDLAC